MPTFKEAAYGPMGGSEGDAVKKVGRHPDGASRVFRVAGATRGFQGSRSFSGLSANGCLGGLAWNVEGVRASQPTTATSACEQSSGITE